MVEEWKKSNSYSSRSVPTQEFPKKGMIKVGIVTQKLGICTFYLSRFLPSYHLYEILMENI